MAQSSHPATTPEAIDRLDRSVPWRFELWSKASEVSPGGELINRGRILAELDWHPPGLVLREIVRWLDRFHRNGTHVAESRLYDQRGQRVVWDNGTTP